MNNNEIVENLDPTKIVFIDADAIAVGAKALASRHGITFDQAMLVYSEQRKASKWFPIHLRKVGKRTSEEIEPTLKTNIPGTKRINHSNHDPLKLRSLASNNNSGCPGVCWNKNSKKWVAYITKERKQYHLGSFKALGDAVCARKSAEKEFGLHA